MRKREEWRPILDAELKRWSATPLDEIVEKLRECQCYEVVSGSKKYQVEIEMVENTEAYIHLMLSVDDGSLLHSIFPLTDGLILHKTRTP